MFDIGFWEIVLISVIGLIVLGPERLPVAIRSVMRWINTAKNMANSVKTEITHELKLHEVNESINKAGKHQLSDIAPEMQKSVDEIKQSTQEIASAYKQSPKKLQPTTHSDEQNNSKITDHKQDKKDEYK